MRVQLLTRCGCTKFVDVGDDALEYNEPVFAQLHVDMINETVLPVVRNRKFMAGTANGIQHNWNYAEGCAVFCGVMSWSRKDE